MKTAKCLIYILLLILFVSGCHSSTLKSKQVLKVSFPDDPPTLDPRKGGDVISSTMQFMLFEGLTRMTKESSTEPALAEKIDISDDKTVYTFHLRKTKWSDGTLVTAHDFEAAWKKMLSPTFPCPNANLLFPIKNAKKAKEGLVHVKKIGIEALDNKTLRVELEVPTPYFLELTSFCVFCPVPAKTVEDHPEWADKLNPHLIVNGPFKIKIWKKNNKMVLIKNPDYWDADQVELEQIEISFIDNNMTALQMYEKGELDFLGGLFSPIPYESISILADQKLLKTNELGATTICIFNVNTFPFNNKNIRKAFAFAIDREAIVNYITELDEKVAFDPIPPILKDNEVQGFFPTTNHKKKAQMYLKAGLKELGIKASDLNNLTFTYFVGDTHNKVVQTLQSAWLKNLGIKVTIEGYTLKVYLDKMAKKDYDFAYAMWVIQYNDAMNVFDRFKYKTNPKNYPGWEDARYISLLDQSMYFSDQKKRIQFLEKAEEILIEEMPFAPIYHMLNQPFH